LQALPVLAKGTKRQYNFKKQKMMTYLFFLILSAFLNIGGILKSEFQTDEKGNRSGIYDIKLKGIDNRQVTLADTIKPGTVVVLTFWATWCKPCMEEMDAISDKIETWNKNADFELIAISVDDSRSGNKVKSLADGKGWKFTVLKDSNQDLKRKLSINTLPYTIVMQNGTVLKRSVGYSPGNEDALFEEIKKHTTVPK
jgi:peroxiredoxin